ncbi:hypothetical protein PMI25_000700 [Pseudomonas sp. GM30]|nr:hypothetical protein PMI25_000700 [Pseudomonas sp. GM30]
MPTTPTRSVGLTPNCSSGLNTVEPAQNSGPTIAGSRLAGTAIAHAQCERTRSAKPPLLPMMVGCAVPHSCCEPLMQDEQCMQLPLYQPMPTRWPSSRPRTCGPMRTILPTTSWPGTNG